MCGINRRHTSGLVPWSWRRKSTATSFGCKLQRLNNGTTSLPPSRPCHCHCRSSFPAVSARCRPGRRSCRRDFRRDFATWPPARRRSARREICTPTVASRIRLCTRRNYTTAHATVNRKEAALREGDFFQGENLMRHSTASEYGNRIAVR